ncbi:fructose-bisphosphate aldolase class I [SAR202 cluster bacterium AD-804-J14_MRT_500m]|nr:fructose-bisphosphate aldolase class I [SAR202 cluster bacterium AD-804-J14_MRT_500m]
MDHQKLASTAHALVAPAKGILAADESSPTIARRFDSIQVESTEENRRDYREMLFRAKGANNYISGIILFDETIRQNGADGTSLVQVLKDQNIIPGIKVDQSGKDLAGSPTEKITEGLDGLRERLFEYSSLGAQFTKWRAIITIGSAIPTKYCIDVNAHALARYAALSQEAGLVPIVEPEVLMDGDHSIERCCEVTQMTLREVFYQLGIQGVDVGGILLKPNMVLSGKSAKNRATPSEVGKQTVDCFKSVLPPALPGVVFLSGGQSDEEATVNLNAINQEAAVVGAPWQLSFSYGRGLQSAPLKAWAGLAANTGKAQSVFLHRALVTSAARQGAYTQEMEREAATV